MYTQKPAHIKVKYSIQILPNNDEHVNSFSVLLLLKTVTGAMSTLNPPVKLENPANKAKVDYIQDKASQPDFEYPPVCIQFIYYIVVSSVKGIGLYFGGTDKDR